MAIGVEWVRNKLGDRIYAVSHTKAVIRGDHTLEEDLESLEEKIKNLSTKIENLESE